VTQIRIIIADDHPLFRSGLREAIEHEEDMLVLEEAGNGREAVKSIQRHHPDVAVLDIEMSHLSGVDVVRAFQNGEETPQFIMLTIHRSEEVFRAVMAMGVHGYILKESAITDVVNGIRTVYEGEYFVSPVLAAGLFQQSLPDGAAITPGLQELTTTEKKILSMITDNLTTRTIAERLSISPRTVTHHRENISAKLGLRGSYTLLRYALENRGMIQQYLKT
jgi:DNA-binding NarL/FixJ family response regulator